MTEPAAQDNQWDPLQQKLGASFLQSEAWANFQTSMGLKTHKINGNSWSCLLIERKTPLGGYLFAPYGPTITKSDSLATAINQIANYGKQIGASWIRLEPSQASDLDTDFSKLWDSLEVKIIRAPKQVDPLYTRILNLEPPEDELFSGISKTTRYIIRKNKAENTISFKTSTDPADMAKFIQMLGTVSDRNNVFFHPENYFLKEAEALMSDRHMWLEFALKDNEPIASIVMCGFNKTATYLYAASMPEARSTNASALLLWQAMINAKSSGYTKMDLYGIAPEGAGPEHPWYGFTAFKQKFGGTVIRRGETIDLPLKPTYYLYRAVRKIRRLLK